MPDRVTPLQEAIFERSTDRTSWVKLSKKFNVPEWKIRRAYAHWIQTPSERQPLHPTEIQLPSFGPGRPCAMTPEEESVIRSAVLYYADNNTPLHKEGLLDLVQHYVLLLSPERQHRIGFKNNRPSLQWLHSFLGRHNLSYKSMRMIDDKRLEAISEENLAEYISRIKAAIKRYNIRDGSRILNMDQSGVSLEKMLGRSLRKGVGSGNATLVHKAIRTKGNLDRVTVMPVVSANGHSFTPVIVFPGVQPHFRRVNGVIQTVHNFLPPCYFYQREVPGVDSNIIYD